MRKESLAQKSVYWLKVISLGLILGLGIQFAQAWTSPSGSPPSGNVVGGPLTTSGVGQYKQGNLMLNTDGIYANALVIHKGRILADGGAESAYGAITLQGSKAGYSGINFKDAGGLNAGSLLMNSTYSGFFNAADNNWRWYVDDAGNSRQQGNIIVGGNIGLGTATPNPAKGASGYLDVADVYLRSTGKWASNGTKVMSGLADMDHWNAGLRCKWVDITSAGFTSSPHVIVSIADTGLFDPRPTPAYDSDRSIAYYWSVLPNYFYACCGSSSHASSDFDLGCRVHWLAIGS